MTPRLSGHFSIFGLVFFVFKSLLGIARQWSLEKFAILSLKPQSRVRILIYRKRAIADPTRPHLLCLCKLKNSSIHTLLKADDLEFYHLSGPQQYPEIRLIGKKAHIKHCLVVIYAERIIIVKYATYAVAKRKPGFNLWNSLSNFYWSLTWKCLLPVMCLYLTPFSSNAFAITTNTSCHYREMKHNMDS